MLRLALVLSILALTCGGFAETGGGATNSASKANMSNARIVCTVFGRYCVQAIRVASCESGLNIWARNGQYLGLFQMGGYARSRYGHGNSAWVQARAAYRYFIDSGRDWSPWSCKPY